MPSHLDPSPVLGVQGERFTALPYLGHQGLAVFQPAVGRLGLPAGLTLPEQVLLNRQRRVRDGLKPVGFG